MYTFFLYVSPLRVKLLFLGTVPRAVCSLVSALCAGHGNNPNPRLMFTSTDTYSEITL